MEMLSITSLLFLIFLVCAKCLIAYKVHSRAMRTDGTIRELLKCKLTGFFYLLDQIFMLLSYENRTKKFLINFSFPRLRRTSVKFYFLFVQYRARWETGDSRSVT